MANQTPTIERIETGTRRMNGKVIEQPYLCNGNRYLATKLYGGPLTGMTRDFVIYSVTRVLIGSARTLKAARIIILNAEACIRL